MKRPSPEVIKALANTVRQHPEVLEWLEGWRTEELSRLPNATQNTALAQGRCQILIELSKLVKESPETAAKS